MTVVVVVADAEDQLREVIGWWGANRREAPSLPLEEFGRCVALLAERPDIGARFRRSDVPGVRRLLMRRARCFVYYVHDATHDVAYVLAVWGAPKVSAPPIRDPRA